MAWAIYFLLVLQSLFNPVTTGLYFWHQIHNQSTRTLSSFFLSSGNVSRLKHRQKMHQMMSKQNITPQAEWKQIIHLSGKLLLHCSFAWLKVLKNVSQGNAFGSRVTPELLLKDIMILVNLTCHHPCLFECFPSWLFFHTYYKIWKPK